MSIGAMVEMDENDGIRSVWLSGGRNLSALCDRYVGQLTAALETKGKRRPGLESSEVTGSYG